LQLQFHTVTSPPELAHRFSDIAYRGVQWDLSHLDPFTFKLDLGLDSEITILVLYSCHCFSHSFHWDKRPRHAIPHHEIYFDGREHRVLNPLRYELSRRFLRDVVWNLFSRRITVANEKMPNFVTIENVDVDADGKASLYAIFFEVRKDRSRKCRLVLRVQSAYLLDNGLTSRQMKGGKIAFETLLRSTYLGKRIRG
jgi:hypothetical protein